MKIYTKCGDDGKTSLLGNKRLKKCDIFFDVLGTLDELSSCIGLIKPCDKEKVFYDFLENIQKNLMKIMSGIAIQKSSKYEIEEEDIKNLEEKIDELYKLTGEEFTFVLPGKTELSARFDFARTVARRAERLMVKAKKRCRISENYLKFINRLSDYLYVSARYAEKDIM